MDSGRPSKNDRRSLALLLNNRVDDGHFFGCLAGNEVGISLRHGDGFMSHEFFQLKKCNLSRLGKPRGKCMAKSVESNMVSAIRITIIYPKSTKSVTKRIRDTRNRCSVHSARLKNVPFGLRQYPSSMSIISLEAWMTCLSPPFAVM